MLELYQTPLDILYFTITVVVSLLGLFLILAAFQLFRLLKNINSVSEKVKDTVDLVNHYLWQPIKIFMMLMEKGKEYVAEAAKEEKKAPKKKKKSKK